MSEITALNYKQQLAAAVRAEWGRLGLSRTEFQKVIGRSRPTAASRWEGESDYIASELEKIASRLGITPYNLNESAALGVRFAESNTTDDEVARITPPVDVYAQPARSKARRAS
jgi:transcriptional regulator with XRE-family HTH domain